MKKKIVSILTLLSVIGILGGCGNAEDSLQNLDVEKYVTLGVYKGVEVTVEPLTVPDEEVDALVASAYANNVTAENGGITDRAVELGDTANIDYVGKKDDVAFDGGTASAQNLTIGSGQFIAGFEDGLIGVMPGETVDLNLTFPEGYHNADLAGADVVFTVTVNFIVPTDMKDEVVAAMGIEGVTTIEDLRQDAYEYLYTNAEYNYTANVDNTIFGTFMEGCTFAELPQEFVDSYREMTNESVALQAQSYGMDAESFVTVFYNMTLEEFLTKYGEDGAKQDIALMAVAKQEGLTMSDEELDLALQQAMMSAGAASVEEYLAGESKEDYKNFLECQKAYEFIIENAVVNN